MTAKHLKLEEAEWSQEYDYHNHLSKIKHQLTVNAKIK